METRVLIANKTKIQRKRNLREGSDLFLQAPPVYMKPHKNSLNHVQKMKEKYKPKTMVGDLRKPNCEFTSDLNIIAHKTRLIKKKMVEMGTTESASLKQERLRKRIARKNKLLAKIELQDLTDEEDSFNGSQIDETLDDLMSREMQLKWDEDI